MMKLNLPADVTVKGVTFGTPRVGNDKFAAFFDSKVCCYAEPGNSMICFHVLMTLRFFVS